MSELNIYEKITEIINKKSLQDGNIINVGNYEIVAKPENINTYFLANKSLISLISSVCVCIIFFANFATL